AIAGSALAGPADFIAEARIWQKRHGGKLIQIYPYVISARLKLRERLPRFPGYHQRALSVARALTAIPGVRVNPDPPHAHMMHVFLPGDPETLMERALEIARQERVALFRALRPADVPGYAAFELTVGDATCALEDTEIEALFR